MGCLVKQLVQWFVNWLLSFVTADRLVDWLLAYFHASLLPCLLGQLLSGCQDYRLARLQSKLPVAYTARELCLELSRIVEVLVSRIVCWGCVVYDSEVADGVVAGKP